MAKKYDSLAHTKYYTRYHIVFTPKYRRKIIYNQLRRDIAEYIKRLCTYKGVEIIEGHMMPDHVHILVSIPPKISVSSFMGYLKGKLSMMIFEKHGNLKYKFGKWNFTKFVIDREGNVVARFEPTADMEKVEACIKSLL